ncbi:MAG: DUF433 domain-containing protein [Bacteroidota bacterium]|nr:DUF433 domain-containing protein [Bacteroidota bacterium]
MQIFDRITFDPQVMGGQACVRGLRIPVSLVINLIANKMSMKDILKEYPDLEEGDIQQCLQYVAWLAKEETHLLANV